MTNSFDGNYDRTKPWRDNFNYGEGANSPYGEPLDESESWSYTGPWASNQEKLMQQALLVNTMRHDQIQKLVRPPLPQIRLFPQTTGYPTGQIGIDDVVSIDRSYTEPRVSWFSGGVGGYSGTSRNGLEGV